MDVEVHTPQCTVQTTLLTDDEGAANTSPGRSRLNIDCLCWRALYTLISGTFAELTCSLHILPQLIISLHDIGKVHALCRHQAPKLLSKILHEVLFHVGLCVLELCFFLASCKKPHRPASAAMAILKITSAAHSIAEGWCGSFMFDGNSYTASPSHHTHAQTPPPQDPPSVSPVARSSANRKWCVVYCRN